MKQIFINLVVSDLERSMQLYTAMGFVNNPKFSDETAKCMVWSEHIYLMIMTADKFKGFVTRPIADTLANIAAIYSLSVDSIDTMNKVTDAALAAGATEPTGPKDYGFMQQRTIEDYDGHVWEIFFMDMSQFPVQE